METIHFVDVPETLTRELLIKCVYDDYQPIRQAALKKVICDNLLSDAPILDLWDADWKKLKIEIPDLSNEIYKYTIEYQAYAKGLKIFDTILTQGTYYATYINLCELLKKNLTDELRQSVLEVIKKHSSEKTEKLISQLFLRRANRPELGGIILHILENTKDLATLCKLINVQDVNHKHRWNDEYLPKICNIIIPHMDMLSTLRIAELCDFNSKLEDVEETITSRVVSLINNLDDTQSDNKNAYNNATDIAELLPQQFGTQIFRLLVQKQKYEYLNDYMNYICNEKGIYPKQEFEFIFQNVGEEIDIAHHGIVDCIVSYINDIELTSKFITALDNNRHLVPALAKNYEKALHIVNSLQDVIYEAHAQIERISKLNILPKPVESPQKRYQNLINTCQKLIEKIYTSLSNNGKACAQISLCFERNWQKYQDMWNINDAEFQQDFLEHLSTNNSSKANEIQKEFCKMCKIPLPKKQLQDTPYCIDYIIGVLKLLEVPSAH